MPTHYAVVTISGRIIPVQRMGRVLFVLGYRCGIVWARPHNYDHRFYLLPATYQPAAVGRCR
jgi:hypothetical protein